MSRGLGLLSAAGLAIGCSSTGSDPPAKPVTPPPPTTVVVDAGPPPDLALDPTFGSNGVLGVSEITIRDFAVDSQSRIVLGGERYRLDGHAPSKEDGMRVRRLAEDGTADVSFGQGGAVSVPFPELTTEMQGLVLWYLFLQENDGIIVSGQQSGVVTPNGQMRNRNAFARLLPDGAIAPDAGQVVLPVGDVVKESQYDRLIGGFALSDGRMLYVGNRAGVLLARSSPGATTPGYGEYDVRVFPGTLGAPNAVAAEQVVRTKTGSLVIAGSGTSASSAVVAFVSDVEGDPKVRTIFERKSAHLSRLVVDNDGNVVVVVTAPFPTPAAIVRIRPDGTLDPTFGANGELALADANDVDARNGVAAVAIDAAQRLLVLEAYGFQNSAQTPSTAFRVRRLLHDGSLDSSFHDHGTLSSAQMAQACTTCSPEVLDCLVSSNNERQLIGLLIDGKGRGIVISQPTGSYVPHCLVRFIP